MPATPVAGSAHHRLRCMAAAQSGVTIVRHAESSYNITTEEQKRVANLVGASHDLRDADLTTEGEQQAHYLARIATSRFPGVRTVITSPLRRALRTAMAIADALGAKLIVSPALREIRRDVSDIGTPGSKLDEQFPGLGLEELPNQWWMEDCACAEQLECDNCIEGRIELIRDIIRENDGAVIVSHSDVLREVCGVDLDNGECATYEPCRNPHAATSTTK